MGQNKGPCMPLGIRHMGTPSAATGKINTSLVKKDLIFLSPLNTLQLIMLSGMKGLYNNSIENLEAS
jgi:hypothetical protein